MADYLGSLAAAAGLDVEWMEVAPKRSNLIVRLIPKGAATRRIVLAPHFDTVGEEGMPQSMFEPRMADGKIHGRGSCDTKGSVAVMFQLLLDIAKKGPRPRETELVFVGLVDEENGQIGSRAVAKAGLKADLAIVGEPTQCKVLTAHKGNLWLKLHTEGKAAHGSRPELGKNAALAMARVVIALEEEYGPGLAAARHPLLGPGTVNVGAIHGGTQPNIVPDACEIWVDRRTIPGEEDGAICGELRRFFKERGLKVRIESTKDGVCPPMQTNPGVPLVKELTRIAGQRKPMGARYFCDAAILASNGTPAVVFGPGDIAQAHTREEWVALESLELARAILAKFLGIQP